MLIFMHTYATSSLASCFCTCVESYLCVYVLLLSQGNQLDWSAALEPDEHEGGNSPVCRSSTSDST